MKLTPRQMQVLRLIAEDNSLKQIGGKLGVSRKTVEGHLREAREKVGPLSLVGITRWAIKNGMVEL